MISIFTSLFTVSFYNLEAFLDLRQKQKRNINKKNLPFMSFTPFLDRNSQEVN